jgi:4-hydroxybenzoate polyprenyltransferase
MGYFACSSSSITSFPRFLLPYILVSFFSYANFVLIGYLKDISADKATGYKTFPVTWGWQKTLFLGDAFAVVTIIFFWCTIPLNTAETVTAVIASFVILFGQLMGHRTKEKNERGALIPILSTVRSFILFHIAIVLHFHPAWLLYMVGYYILFEIFLLKRPSRFQV